MGIDGGHMDSLILYNYYRSSSSYRVRLALHYKKLTFEYRPINLLTQENRQAEFLAIHPSGQVPVLEHGEIRLSQSLAIIQYLEQKFPHTPLLPEKNQTDFFRIWEFAETINSTQPLHNFPVLKSLESEGFSQSQVHRWILQVLDNSFRTLKGLRDRFSHPHIWALGKQISLADCLLIPQLYVAIRFEYPLKDKFPEFEALRIRYLELDWVRAAHPHAQPDCPENLRDQYW